MDAYTIKVTAWIKAGVTDKTNSASKAAYDTILSTLSSDITAQMAKVIK